jgi:SAM-dependent methyltransferase
VFYHILRYIRIPKSYTFLYRMFDAKDDFKILDVGCGKNGAKKVKTFFPKCQYYAIDKDPGVNLNDVCGKYFHMDLEKLDFNNIPGNFFDVIVMNHVIEHLRNGDQVIEKLLSKLGKRGVIYIEFPSFWSTKLPSKKGTLNFFDDSTHCRLYSLMEIFNLLMRNGCVILKGGTRRNLVNNLLIPYNAIRSLRSRGYIAGSVFWDLLGFCQYVLAMKK